MEILKISIGQVLLFGFLTGANLIVAGDVSPFLPQDTPSAKALAANIQKTNALEGTIKSGTTLTDSPFLPQDTPVPAATYPAANNGSSSGSNPKHAVAANVKKPRSTTISTTNPVGPFANGGQVTKVIDINYAHADPAFKQKVENVWQNISGGNPNGYLSAEQGSSSIYVRGDEQHVIDLENYISSLDKPITQIRIDAVILSANRTYNFDLGFNWSGIYNRAQNILLSGNPFGLAGLGGFLTDMPEPTGAVGTESPGTTTQTAASYTTTQNLFVDPTNFALNMFNKVYSPTTGSNAGDSFVQFPLVFGGSDLNLRRLSLMLNAAENESKVKIISRPSVLTSDKQTATVIIGSQLPMQQSQLNNTGGSIYKGNSINYRSVGISLNVTPTVGADNKSITLKIDVRDIEIIAGTTQSNADGIMTNPPVLSDLTVTNNIVLKSGQTTVIGGLAKRQDNNTRNRVPLLYRLPVVGTLFTANLNSELEQEQFIFITPTIIEEDL